MPKTTSYHNQKQLFSTFGVGFYCYDDSFPEMNSNTAYHIFDAFDDDHLQEVFSNRGMPGMIVSDSMLSYDGLPDEVKFVGLPLWINRERKQWMLSEFDNKLPVTTSSFNFMINRSQTSRYLLCKLVDILLTKSDYSYTYSGTKRNFDCTAIVNELNLLGERSPLTASEKGQLLSPVKLKTNFVMTNTTDATQVDTGNSAGGVEYGNNKHSWQSLKHIFFNSGIALITESTEYQKASMTSEKSLFPIFGLNFPIWVGGYCEADAWKNMGFDVFDDVINHDYQRYDTLVERCVYAIKLNLKLLTDVELVAKLRQQHHERLLENRYKLLTGELEKFIEREVSTVDPDWRPALDDVVNLFKHSKTNML